MLEVIPRRFSYAYSEASSVLKPSQEIWSIDAPKYLQYVECLFYFAERFVSQKHFHCNLEIIVFQGWLLLNIVFVMTFLFSVMVEADSHVNLYRHACSFEMNAEAIFFFNCYLYSLCFVSEFNLEEYSLIWLVYNKCLVTRGFDNH